MASMEVSGKAALQENSDRHLTASWKEAMVAGKCWRKIRSVRESGVGGRRGGYSAYERLVGG